MAAQTDYTIKRFGNEQEPIVLIDNFYSDPEMLVDVASQSGFSKNSDYYPGIRAFATSAYLSEKQSLLTEIMQNVFAITRGIQLIECNYSMVTTQAKDLALFQCFPHYDGLERGRLALLHYLCDSEFGGTSFYRHRLTGYESINAERFTDYNRTRTEEVQKNGLPNKQYITGSNTEFEQIGRIDATFNRMAIYRGCTLHSGQIPEHYDFKQDPKNSRLTINTFLMDMAELG